MSDAITWNEYKDNFSDPMWRLSHLYKIISKDAQVITFVPNDAQAKFLK